jgi:RHS repeat-associated protein
MRWNYHLNFPSRITYSNGRVINYVYSASGAKLKVSHKPSGIGITTTTDYVNGYIFTNDSLSMALTDNGYFTLSGTGVPTYHFYLKDHQGNNRVVVSQSGSVEQTNHYYPYGALFAESMNGDVQRFKYNGKELDRKFGLNWYDHGARHNDAAIGRWHSIDKNAEKYYGISPYAYCGGDPVNFGDYDGESIYMVTKSGKILMLLPTNDEFDDLIGWDGNDNLQYIQTRDQSTITSLYKSKTNGKNNKDNYALSDSPESKYLFEFFADVTDNEWSLEVFNNNGKTQYLLGTSNKEGETGLFYNTTDMKEAGIREEDMIWKVHSHSQMWGEGGTPGGSGFGPEWGDKIQGDKLSWIKLNVKFQKYHKPVPRTYVYHRKSRTYYQYKGNIGNILVQGGINSLK